MTYEQFLAKEPEGTRRQLEELFAGLPPATPVRVANLAPGEIFMRQGDTRWDVFVLVAGSVNVLTQQNNFTTYVLRDFTPFALFGHYESLADYPHIIATICAKTKCRLLVIGAADYMRWVESDTGVMLRQMRSALATLMLQGTHDRNTLFLRSEERIASLLADCHQMSRRDGEEKAVVKMSHLAMAEITGLSLRTVNRVLARFRQEGLVGVEKGKVTLTDAQCARLRGLVAE